MPSRPCRMEGPCGLLQSGSNGQLVKWSSLQGRLTNRQLDQSTPTISSKSPSRTPGRGLLRSISTGSSSPISPPKRAGRDWGWPWPTRPSRSMAAASMSRALQDRERPSSSRFPLSRAHEPPPLRRGNREIWRFGNQGLRVAWLPREPKVFVPMDPLRILIVDDETPQRELVGGFLKKQGHEVFLAGSGAEALSRVKETRVDLVISDFEMPGMSGIELLRGVKAVNPEIPFILVTAYGTVETAVQAMKEGAADYVTKPLDLEELLLRIGRAGEQLRLQSAVRDLQARLVERHRLEGIIGESGRMQEVLALVKQVAPSDATVLIRGESGTGKELVARAIHFNSARAAGPLVTLNCAALPEQLLESELFGHERRSEEHTSE